MNTKTLQILTLASGFILLNACGGGSKSTTPDANTSVPNTNTTQPDVNTTVPDTNTTQPDVNTTVPVVTSITHNGTTYGFVTSPHTKRVWLDRNLGAARVCQSPTDVACYGDYYQWGRNTDGHEDKSSSVTTVLSPNINDAGHTGFIKSPANPYDWASVDLDGTARAANWYTTNGMSVCPTGFGVPSRNELYKEVNDAKIDNSGKAFASFLKIPKAGYRSGISAEVYKEDSLTRIWTGGRSGKFSELLSISDTAIKKISLSRGFGLSVRCIKK